MFFSCESFDYIASYGGFESAGEEKVGLSIKFQTVPCFFVLFVCCLPQCSMYVV